MLITLDHAGAAVGGIRLAFLLLLTLVEILPAGCQSPRAKAEEEARTLESDPLSDPNHVVAEVNGHPITRGEYYRRVLNKFGTMTMISGLIKEDLFFQEAKKRNLVVKPEEVKAKVDELIAREAAKAGGRDKLEEIYRAQGLRLEDVRRDYARDAETHLLVGRVTKALRQIDDQALRAYYQTTYARTRYRVRHIPYRYPLGGLPEWDLARRKLEAREKAERTAKRIRDGADFAQIARQESEEEETRAEGGDLGYISEDTPMDPVMKETILKLKPLEVSEPVENNLKGAYHVVQVTEVVPHKSYAESEAQMKKELAENEPDREEIVEALEKLARASSIKIFGFDMERPPAPASTASEAKP